MSNCDSDVRNAGLVPALFMHIQKTAGTSIVDLARIHYGSDRIISHGDHLEGFNEFPLKDKYFTTEQIRNRFDKIPFVSGHFGYDFAKTLMPGRYTYTFLRDPAERILSLYYFCKNRNPNEFRIYRLCQEVSLDEFLYMGLRDPSVMSCIWNTQTWQLAHGYGNTDGRDILRFSPDEMLDLAIRHLGDFSYIGFAESFEHDRDNILKSLGMELPSGKVVSNANPDRPTAKDLPETTLRLLDELTGLDQLLYSEAQQLQKQRQSQKGLSKNVYEFGKAIKKWLVN